MVKKFIDKKKATTYKLVYRSQEDPLAFEEGTTERVFVAVGGKDELKASKGKQPEDQTLEQSRVYGIYLDDREYDYTKHLRPVGSGGGILLEAAAKKEKFSGIQIMDVDEDDDGVGASGLIPIQAQPSAHRMDIKSAAFPTGLQPSMNTNLREEDVEEFDDDFFDRLNSNELPSDAEENESDDGYHGGKFGRFGDEDDEDGEGFDPNDVFAQVRRMKARQRQQDSDDDENNGGDWRGTRTASTGLSMSSSAMYRNEKLTLLDEHFDRVEAMYEHEDTDSEDERYDENGHHIDEYDADGNLKSISTRPDFADVMDEFLSEYELTGKKLQVVVEGGSGAGKLDTYRDAFLDATKPKDQSKQDVVAAGMRITEEDNARPTRSRRRTPWDCQTILSTYSTLDNHPATIYVEKTPKIRVSRKTGFPMVERNNSDEEDVPRENKGQARSKAETSEEKRARKKQIQEEKRNRRDERNDTRSAFAEKRDRKMQSKKDRAQYVIRLD
ncbi:Low temperature viability protein-domain-containing protein [Kickxella alabastrina]|uniref:Low temperature viability protein-domain-containing protein n=1 Tax=Kickxella alabastrina TaxID=61397 RepID=UPI00221E9C41|nr:Low temperature viability protein-domain-containing protein [Kickxella alabastrina]KAI7830030.1 Low temperature viability protein-domain-containing protein [Kickxella alabastrina]